MHDHDGFGYTIIQRSTNILGSNSADKAYGMIWDRLHCMNEIIVTIALQKYQYVYKCIALGNPWRGGGNVVLDLSIDNFCEKFQVMNLSNKMCSPHAHLPVVHVLRIWNMWLLLNLINDYLCFVSISKCLMAWHVMVLDIFRHKIIVLPM